MAAVAAPRRAGYAPRRCERARATPLALSATLVQPASVQPASRALERGTQFLLARQGSDGLWRDFLTPAGEASEWPTGVIGTALHAAGADPSALERAADALVARQNDDGGWGYHEDVPTDADSTAAVLRFLARTGRHEAACARAGACLATYQRPDDGGIATYRDPAPIHRFMGVGRWWRFDGWCSPQTEVTAAAGSALAAIGRDAEAAAAWRCVRSRQRDNGSFGSYWWTTPHYATHQATDLAVRFGDHDAASRAADWVLRTGSLDAAVFATALSLSILLDAGASRATIEPAIAHLVAQQDDDGGWPSGPIMRIPMPNDRNPDRRRLVHFGRGIVVRDQHRTFTTAACIAALARARDIG